MQAPQDVAIVGAGPVGLSLACALTDAGFTDDRAPARLARAAVLGIAERLPPLKAAITRRLTAAHR